MFNAVKAAQVIAYLALKTPDHALDVLKAIKLVYLADRESIRRWGSPILNERRVSMPHGPVNSETYSHINGEHDLDECGWSLFLDDKANHVVAARPDVEIDRLDELSDADIQCLDAVWERFGGMNKWALRDWTHVRENVPEWENPEGSSRTIPLERIMTMVGVPNADCQAQLVNDQRDMLGLLSRLAQ